jgi:hypothetical protein
MENQRMDESIARKRRIQGLTTALALCLGMLSAGTAAAAPPTHFDISFPAAVRAQPVTGRVFVVISRTASPDPRVQVLSEESPPFFAADVHAMQPGQSVTINQTTPGYPLVCIAERPACGRLLR